MRNMDTELSQLFFKETSNIFRFLVTDYSFSQPKFEIDEQIGFVIVTFMSREIAFECILDESENDITCKVVKVMNAKKVNNFSVNDKGERVREDLASLLRRKGIRDRLFTKRNEQIRLEDEIKIVLSDYAQMLKKYVLVDIKQGIKPLIDVLE